MIDEHILEAIVIFAYNACIVGVYLVKYTHKYLGSCTYYYNII